MIVLEIVVVWELCIYSFVSECIWYFISILLVNVCWQFSFRPFPRDDYDVRCLMCLSLEVLIVILWTCGNVFCTISNTETFIIVYNNLILHLRSYHAWSSGDDHTSKTWAVSSSRRAMLWPKS